jgi:mannose-6-phosphate isomerase-like protein (cupin superfamily)
MKGYFSNIEKETIENKDYRRVLYTGHNMQLVVMSLKPGIEIGNETHTQDQFIRVEAGEGKAILNNGDDEHILKTDDVVIIPAGTSHNVINIGNEELKLYTIYAPPVHLKDTVQPNKEDEVEDHFDGITSE